MIERSGVKLDGSNFRSKPSTAITMAAWVNSYSLAVQGSVQQIFVANDFKQRGKMTSLKRYNAIIVELIIFLVVLSKLKRLQLLLTY